MLASEYWQLVGDSRGNVRYYIQSHVAQKKKNGKPKDRRTCPAPEERQLVLSLHVSDGTGQTEVAFQSVGANQPWLAVKVQGVTAFSYRITQKRRFYLNRYLSLCSLTPKTPKSAPRKAFSSFHFSSHKPNG